MNSKKLLFFIVVFLFSNPSFTQNNEVEGNKKIPVKQLLEDLNILKNNLEDIHAGLYNYTSKEKLDAKFNDIKLQIKSPLKSIEFYRLIAPLHQYIKNGHTIIIPSERFDNATNITKPVFPIDVYWNKGSLYVLRNNSDNLDITIGTRIDSINGENASKVFKMMSELWTRDGNNTTFPEGITQRAFSGFYVNFIGAPKIYNISYKNNLGQIKNIDINALPTPEINKNRQKRYGDIHDYWQKGDGDAVTLEIKKNIAHLKIKTCSNSDIRKFGRSIKGIMKGFFKEMREHDVEHLIVDLRNNGGGDEIISRELFRHISTKPFILFNDSYLITKKISNKQLYKENISKMNTFAKIGLYKGKDGNYRLNSLGRLVFRSAGRLKSQKPYKKKYRGKIYTLTNAYSFSAAGEIASSMKTNTKSVFIGEEPGGNATHIVAGEVFTLVLPHSKNRVRIPIVNQVVNTTATPSDRGVIPDHEIKNSIDDMINGRDAVLEFTYKLINNSK